MKPLTDEEVMLPKQAGIKYLSDDEVMQPSKQQGEMTWSEAGINAVQNIPKSAGEYVGAIAHAVTSPIETGGNLVDVFTGAVQNAIPEFMQSESARPQREKAAAVGKFFTDRYGSVDGFKNAVANDPVGVMADISTVLTAGGALAAKLPGVAGKVGRAVNIAGKAVDPLNLAIKATKPVASLAGKAAAELIGGLGTHSGGETIKTAAKVGHKAGATGSDAADMFTANMRGAADMTDVLDTVRSNVAEMGKAKQAAYRAGMAQVAGDKTVLKFGGIDNAISNASDIVSFKGQVKNAKAADVLRKIGDEVKDWKSLNPSDFHTPEGLDALKQKIGAIVESVPFEEKTARLVGREVYQAVKNEITKQAPVYAKTMKGYSEATEQIKEIERALSAGQKASADTAMRKLQSIMRNNANTNYGNRLDLVKKLEQAGGKEIMPALAGQASNSWAPRGLGKLMASANIGAGILSPGLLALLPFQSPRLVGEASYLGGRAAGAVNQARMASNNALAGIGGLRGVRSAAFNVGRLDDEETNALAQYR